MNSDVLRDAEARFLNRVRRATTGTEPSSRLSSPDRLFTIPDDSTLRKVIDKRSDAQLTGLIETFQENGSTLGLHVYLADSTEEAADRILVITADREVEFGTRKHIIQHHSPLAQKLALWKRIGLTGAQLHTAFPEDPELREKTVASFIGITAADWGVADSATLVQLTRPGAPRSTSLVPSIHIALLARERMLANLAEAYCMLRREGAGRGVTFITGPSKTADIEAHMVHGAHGPREMHVIIV